MGFITSITTRITDWPKDGETAQEARDDAVIRGVLPPEQSPHLKVEEIVEPAKDTDSAR